MGGDAAERVGRGEIETQEVGEEAAGRLEGSERACGSRGRLSGQGMSLLGEWSLSQDFRELTATAG
jgi:hypothetical protein